MPGDIANRPDRDAGRSGVDQQETDAFLLLAYFARAHEQVNMRRVMRKGRPDLLPVDDEVGAVRHGGRGEARQIGARVGFGIALPPDVLAGEDFRQVILFLLVAAVFHDDGPDLHDAVIGHARDAVIFVLFEQYDHLAGIQPHAAVFARPVGREPAMLRHRQVPFLHLGKPRATQDVAQMLRIVRGKKFAHFGAELVVAQSVEIGRHHTSSGSIRLARQ